MKTLQKFVLTVTVIAIAGSTALAQQALLQPAIASPAVPQGSAMTVADPQGKDELFAGTEIFAKGASNVAEINLDPSMMGMVNKKVPSDLAGKMSYMMIHTYSYDKPGMYRMEDVEVFRKKLTDGSWTCPIHVREKSGSTDICTRSGGGRDHETTELVILAAEERELTFIHMGGHMTMEDLMKIGMKGKGKDGGDPALKRR